MFKTIIAAAAFLTIASAAHAQSSHCWWEQGVFACDSSVQHNHDRSTVLCAASSIEGKCQTFHSYIPYIDHPRSGPRCEVVTATGSHPCK